MPFWFRAPLGGPGEMGAGKDLRLSRFQQDEKNLALVQKLLSHSSEAATLRYIGITKEEMDNVYLELNLGK
jgi:hypothetical protein